MERSLLALLLTGLAACSAACSKVEPDDPLAFSGSSMGTTWRVQVAATGVDSAEVDSEPLEAELREVLASVDAAMSTYRTDSELSRFNRSRSTDWFPVSADTATVVAAALEIAARTDGAFDVTAGPLVNLWGFGPGPRPSRAPTEEELAAARASTGPNLLKARTRPPGLRMQVAARYVDLSAIAKGFAVDRLAKHLETRGITDYLVELGGELRAGGRRSADVPWRVGLERPAVGGRTPMRAIALQDRAVATSGDYRNFRMLAAQRYTHVLDPRSGRPVLTNVCSATVVCATAMEADALATALMVLGAEEGLRFAERAGLPAQIVSRVGEQLRVRSTPTFEDLVVGTPEGGSGQVFLAGLAVMLLAVTGLAAGLLLRGRPLRAGCRGSDDVPRCSGCKHRTREA